MAGEDEYEIMPHRTIENIKKELEELKLKAASKDAVSSEAFKKSLDNLSGSINNLMDLFKEATEGMKIEEETEAELKSRLVPLMNKVDDIENENKTIAQAILAVADLIETRMPESRPAAQPEREIIRRTYKETIKPKGMEFPPLKPIKEMKPIPPPKITQPGARHTFAGFRPSGPMPPGPMPLPRGPETPVSMPPGPMPPPAAPPKLPAVPPLGAPQAGRPLPPGPMPPREMPPGPIPPGPLPGAMPLPPAKKEGFFSKLFKKK